jgi:CDP-6-deoxy-D-xylo-4-hexulose-3-dehydrase
MIDLVKDTIDNEDVNDLIEWLKTNPRLTKGELTKEFEQKWSDWMGVKYSIYVNSGSSANLLMAYKMKLMGIREVIVPAVSWATTIAPFIQFGITPILCDCDKDNLGIDVEHLQSIVDDPETKPEAVVMTHILGFPSHINEIKSICDNNNMLLVEDSCETFGSTYDKKKTGTFGLMSTFSLYFGHHLSTIEGGMICTESKEVYNDLLMLRSHGWDRDLSKEDAEELRVKHNIDGFKSLYTFYLPGFNVRATDLQARIGLRQLDKADDVCKVRHENFMTYDKLINNSYWKVCPYDEDVISNFAYPIIHPKRDMIVKELEKNDVQCRPLVAGSMQYQPFLQVQNYYVKKINPFADEVEKFGMYVPNHQNLTTLEVEKVCEIINSVIGE